MAAEGEAFKSEEKVWEEIKTQPFKSRPIKFVVCLNTMGQDRELTAEQKTYALKTVQFFRDTWEATEIKNLEADIKRKVHNLESEK